jgi:thiamine biosynthesis lipoprotein
VTSSAFAPGSRHVRVEHLWGTAITLDLRDSLDPEVPDRVYRWFRRVDDLFSTWRTDTEISRLARGELGAADVSTEVATVLALCDRVRGESDGAFDVRFAADPRVPPADGRAPIDPSGLVKGWALDQAASMLREAGAVNFAIGAGGDVIVAGSPDGDTAWRVGIQHPSRRDRVAMVLAVTDAGVATSGRYERGDHIIDPRTGRPAVGWMSCSVVHERLALADGYATAALVLGAEGPDWLARRGLAGCAIGNDDRVVTTAMLDRHRAR